MTLSQVRDFLLKHAPAPESAPVSHEITQKNTTNESRDKESEIVPPPECTEPSQPREPRCEERTDLGETENQVCLDVHNLNSHTLIALILLMLFA